MRNKLDKLKELSELLKSRAITQEEFEKLKKEVLSPDSNSSTNETKKQSSNSPVQGSNTVYKNPNVKVNETNFTVPIIVVSVIIVGFLLINSNNFTSGNNEKKTCICTTTYSGEGSEYYEDETVIIESYNGCDDEEYIISQDGLTIKMKCTQK